jgi:hypothetical protein
MARPKKENNDEEKEEVNQTSLKKTDTQPKQPKVEVKEDKKPEPRVVKKEDVVPDEPKYPARQVADSLGINRFDLDTILKLGNINKKELITQTKMLDLYNKIIGR